MPTSISDGTAFLYTGAGAIQVPIPPSQSVQIDQTRVGVIRGRVLQSDGVTPFQGVNITVLGHNEFGQTSSRSDGWFDLAVSAGGLYNVVYTYSGACGNYEDAGASPSGCLTVQRQAQTRWLDFTVLPDVVMTPHDPVKTVINTSGNQMTWGVHVASQVSDSDGKRQGLVFFPPGTSATFMVNGQPQPASQMTVHATEYTVGATGAKAMPAALPANSGYTYAVELSSEEAESLGATSVTFSNAYNNSVFFYVDNFIFPTTEDGGAAVVVPAGHFDRVAGQWVADASGEALDITGCPTSCVISPVPGNMTAAEQTAVEAQFQNATMPKHLWRVPMNHFTSWDMNWGFGPPPNAIPPQQPLPTGDQPLPDPCIGSGSIIECENQILAEEIPIVGTPYALRYQSERQRGRAVAIDIPVSLPQSGSGNPAWGGAVPAPDKIYLSVDVAGRSFNYLPTVALNQTVRWNWDKNDAYGRYVSGQVMAHVGVGYSYTGSSKYLNTPVFGYNGGGTITGNRALREVVLWQYYDIPIGDFDNKGLGLGGWSLTPNHVYEPSVRTFLGGDGRRRTVSSEGATISTVDSGGSRTGVTVGLDGSLYWSDTVHIRKLDRSGNPSTIIAGNGADPAPPCPDGTSATLCPMHPYGLTVGSDGTLYYADAFYDLVRKISPTGAVTTVAGTLDLNSNNGIAGFGGDMGAATSALLNNPQDVALATDGSLYIADAGNSRIRRVTTDGNISTAELLASNGVPNGVATGLNGDVFFSATYGSFYHLVQKLRQDGTVVTVAGNQIAGCTGYGSLATGSSAELNTPFGVAVSLDGTVYIGDSGCAILAAVDPDGILKLVAGTNQGYGSAGDNGPAAGALLQVQAPHGVAVSPDGTVYAADPFNSNVRRISPSMPGFGASYSGNLLVPSKSGDEIYVFDVHGRHLQTLDTLQGVALATFTPDSSNRTASIQDANGILTTISYSSAGISDPNQTITITSHFGQQTTLTLDANGYLSQVQNPNGEIYKLTHSSTGLLQTLIDPNDAIDPGHHTHSFTYTPEGYLNQDKDPVNATITEVRSPQAGGWGVALTTGQGRTKNYAVGHISPSVSSSGGMHRTFTSPSGAVSTYDEANSDTYTLTDEDSLTTTTQLNGDPRFGLAMPINKSVIYATPGNSQESPLTETITTTRSVTPAGVTLNPATVTDQVTINSSSIYTRAFTSSTSTILETTPFGRQVQKTFDAKGRVVGVSFPSASWLNPVTMAYNQADGTLQTISQGTGTGSRTMTYGYYSPSTGFVQSIMDPLGETTTFTTRDLAGRVTNETLADNSSTITFGYDKNGNMTALTTPLEQPGGSYSGQDHGFGFTGVDLTSQYSPPPDGLSSSSTSYTYDLDRFLLSEARPDGTVTRTTDAFGRLLSISQPMSSIGYVYDNVDRMISVATSDGVGLSLAYDGSLVTQWQWSGTVSGKVSRTYDNFFRVLSDGVSDGSSHSLSRTHCYDSDGLLTSLGVSTTNPPSCPLTTVELSLARDGSPYPGAGLITGSTFGNLAESYTYDAFGALASYTVKNGSANVYALSFAARDSLGRVTQKTETVGANNATTASYAYNKLGQLSCVGSTTLPCPGGDTPYAYDADGNRTTPPATYDAQDRLATLGSTTYAYTSNGDLASKTTGTTVFTYVYDLLGNLRSVSQGTNTLSYSVDGTNHRVIRSWDGTAEQQFLYAGDKLVAEFTGSGVLYAIYAWGARPNVPDYMVLANGTPYRFITDQLGSVRLVVDTSGNVEQQINYDEFGNATVVTDARCGTACAGAPDITKSMVLWQPLGFAGGLYDHSTGLVRFGARDYDPQTGRWTKKDPVKFRGGLNLYGYVVNDPVNFFDPFGLTPGDSWICQVPFIGLACGLNPPRWWWNYPNWGSGYGDDPGPVIGTFGGPTPNPSPKPIMCSAGGRPNGCPPGTVPIDQYGLDRETIHRIKKDLGLGPADWTGIDPDGNICIDDGTGQCICVDNIGGYQN